jgi:hypothetical protein
MSRCISAYSLITLFTLLLTFAYHFIPTLAEYPPYVDSILLFPPATQTYCSEEEDELEFFDEGFWAMRCPGCSSCVVKESFIVPFHKRVALVFRDIIYIINILYS